MIEGTFDKEVKRSKKRRSGSRKKGSKKKVDKEKHHSKTHVHYPPHGSYGGKQSDQFHMMAQSNLWFILGGSKTKRDYEDTKEFSFYKDRTHSMELRSSQDSYTRVDKKKARVNTCSSDVLNQYKVSSVEDEFRNPLWKIKTNNFMYQVPNDENDQRVSNTKTNSIRGDKAPVVEKNPVLKEAVGKLDTNLQSQLNCGYPFEKQSSKATEQKLMEANYHIEMIMGIINKVWKVMQKQIMDPQVRRVYFEKNSPEEAQLKKLLKENELLRKKKESKLKRLVNLGSILDLCCSKLLLKQETDARMYARLAHMENELKRYEEREASMNLVIENHEKNLIKHKKVIEKMNVKLEELDAFKLAVLDQTVHQLCEQEELLLNVRVDERKKREKESMRQSYSSQVQTFGCMSFNEETKPKSDCKGFLDIKPIDICQDLEPVPGYMRALTNEIVYLFDDNQDTCFSSLPRQNQFVSKKVIGGSKQIAPKQPQSPAFYTSSEFLENTSLQIVSSKGISSNNSQKQQERSGEASTASEKTIGNVFDHHKSRESNIYKRYGLYIINDLLSNFRLEYLIAFLIINSSETILRFLTLR